MEENTNENQSVEVTEPKKKNDFWSFIVITLLIVLPIRLFVAQPFIVSGSSMVPTFENGDYLIVDEFSYHFGNPQKGDVIIFKWPKDTTKYFIKRVIGLPGDTVDGTVLSKDQYFVEGDNRNASSDSRSWGPVTRNLIVGRPLIRLLPLKELSVLPGLSVKNKYAN